MAGMPNDLDPERPLPRDDQAAPRPVEGLNLGKVLRRWRPPNERRVLFNQTARNVLRNR